MFHRTSFKSNLTKSYTSRHKNIFSFQGSKVYIAEKGSRHCRVSLISREFVTISELNGQKKSVNFIPPGNKNKCSLLEILTTPKQKLLGLETFISMIWLVLLYWLPDSESILLVATSFLFCHVQWERFPTFRPRELEDAHHVHQVSYSYPSDKLLIFFWLIVLSEVMKMWNRPKVCNWNPQ